MRQITILLSTVLVLVALIGVAPSPKPTSVISGLGQPYDSTGRYHSSLSPYSIVCSWPGHLENSDGIKSDNFVHGKNLLSVFSVPTQLYTSTKTAYLGLVDALSTNNIYSQSLSPQPVKGQTFLGLVFTSSGIVYEDYVAYRNGHIWLIALSGPSANMAANHIVLKKSLASWRWG